MSCLRSIREFFIHEQMQNLIVYKKHQLLKKKRIKHENNLHLVIQRIALTIM